MHLVLTFAGILGTEDLQHVRSFIWESRNRWKDIGLSLGMKYHDLDCISTKHRENPDECFTEMLHKWISSNEATWAGLAKALKHKTVGYEQLAETIELNLRQNEISRIMSESMTVMSNGDGNATRTQRLLAPPDSGKVSFRCPCDKCTLESYLEKGCSKHRSLAYPYLDIERLSEDEQEDLIATLDSDTTDIKRNFAELCNNLSASLKGRRKSAKELVNVITSIDKSLPKELETKTDIDSVFIVLNKRVSFFNYETIGHIVKQLGNKKDKKKMKEYTKKFTEFCKRRVFEVQPGAYESSAECPGRKKFVVLAFKEIDVDSAVSTAKEIQRNIAKLLDIRSSDLQLHRIDKGSVILVFSVPNSVAQDLFPLNQQVIREVEAAGFVVCVPHTTNTNSPSKTPGVRLVHCQLITRVSFRNFGWGLKGHSNLFLPPLPTVFNLGSKGTACIRIPPFSLSLLFLLSSFSSPPNTHANTPLNWLEVCSDYIIHACYIPSSTEYKPSVCHKTKVSC